MKKTAVRILAVCCAAVALVAVSVTDTQAYVGIKAGLFMPNSDSKGLDGFDNGFGGELFGGMAAGPIDIEFGLGGYSAKPEGGDSDDALNVARVNATAKVHLPLGPVSLFGGAGAGYYYAMIGSDSDNPDGNGVGFHVVGGAEFSLGVAALLAEVQWNQAKIKFEQDGFESDKINIGGLMLNVGVLF